MIECTVCKTENDSLALRCTKCGAYIRDRVPALQLFSTLWMLIEAPGAACMRIAYSEQKNYVYLLFFLSGPTLAAIMLFVISAGAYNPRFERLLFIILLWGTASGVIAGATAAIAAKAVEKGKRNRRHRSFRLTAALDAYAHAPLLFASVVLLPIELAVFGQYLFFGLPQLYKPELFWILISLHSLCAAWSLLLLFGFHRRLGDGRIEASLKTLASLVAYGGIVVLGSALIKSIYFTTI